MIAASGTITQLIPPSLVLIVLADQLGRSVGDMYLGATGPASCRCAVRRLDLLSQHLSGPRRPLPPEARTLRGWALLAKCIWGMVPSLVLIFLVLGTIFMGLATPTEAGAMGAVGAIVLAVVPTGGSPFDKCVFGAGCAAAIVGSLIGIVAFKSLALKVAFAVIFAGDHLAVLARLAGQ